MNNTAKRTQGKWNNDLHDGYVYCDGLVVANCYTSLLSPATVKANAEFVATACANHDRLVDIARKVRFWFDNELHYPEGTEGYKIAQQAKDLLKELDNK